MERLIGSDLQLLLELFFIALNIFVLFFGLFYLLFNPVRDVLERRRQKIAGELAEAASGKESATAMKAEYEEKLKEISKEADNTLEDTRKKARTREVEIIEGAKQEAARIMDRASRETELEKKKALDDMKQEVVFVASMMVGKVVAASIDTTIQDALIDKTLKEMGESTWQG